MSKELCEKIFDPFFTTKGKAEGTGLGLSLVYGFVQRSKGHVFVFSELGKGTEFKIYFPRSMEGVSQQKEVVRSVSAKAVGIETILVVDDDDMVRDVIQRSLTKAGYNVISANDGQEGIDLFRKNPDSIDCVLLNFNMPKLDGEEAYRELSLIRADVKVILCSGYVTQETINRFEGTNLAGILKKPVTRQLLLQKISDVLR